MVKGGQQLPTINQKFTKDTFWSKISKNYPKTLCFAVTGGKYTAKMHDAKRSKLSCFYCKRSKPRPQCVIKRSKSSKFYSKRSKLAFG